MGGEKPIFSFGSLSSRTSQLDSQHLVGVWSKPHSSTMTTLSSRSPLPDKLPIIDIAPLLNGDSTAEAQDKRKEVSAALHHACVKYGFFYLNISSYVDPKEPEELARLGREFFKLPQEEKDEISLSKQDHARGAWVYLLWNSVIPCQTTRSRICQVERECHKWQSR